MKQESTMGNKQPIFKLTVKQIAGISVLTALAVVLAVVFHIPIFPAVSFLEYDMADIPIFLGTFMYGPFAGIIMTVVVSVIQGVTVSAGGGWIGIVMHIFATGLYVLVAGILYYRHKTFKGALFAVGMGIVAWMVGMIAWNLILTPIYMGVPRAAVVQLLGYIAAFNAIKVGANSIATLILYKRLRHLFTFISGKVESNLRKRIEKNSQEENADRMETNDVKEDAGQEDVAE